MVETETRRYKNNLGKVNGGTFQEDTGATFIDSCDDWATGIDGDV